MFFNFQLSESSDNVPPSDHLKHQTRTPHRFRPLKQTTRSDRQTRQLQQPTRADRQTHLPGQTNQQPTRSAHQIRLPHQTTILDSASNQHRTPNLLKWYRLGALVVGWVKEGI